MSDRATTVSPAEGVDAVDLPSVDLPFADDLELTEVLAALADPIRLAMVRGLYESGGERTCGSFELPIAKSTASHHWKVLRDAGVCRAREEGTKKYHSLRREDLDARFPGLLESVAHEADHPGRAEARPG